MRRNGFGTKIPRGISVIGRDYFVRQAAILFQFAKVAKDPKISAALLEKAADLKAQVHETMPPADPSPQAPDIEPPAQFSAWRRQMTPQVFIRRHTSSEICDVVVSARGQEIVLRCPNFSQARKWANLECKSYKISEPEIEPLISEAEIEPHIPEPEITPRGGPDHNEELPLFLRAPRNN
jgi:hypothetical protein